MEAHGLIVDLPTVVHLHQLVTSGIPMKRCKQLDFFREKSSTNWRFGFRILWMDGNPWSWGVGHFPTLWGPHLDDLPVENGHVPWLWIE